MAMNVKFAHTYGDLERQIRFMFGSSKYARYYAERRHRIDVRNSEDEIRRMSGLLPSFVKEPDLLCPYCFDNKNYKCCAQCDGKGRIDGFRLDDRGNFIGLIKSGEQIQ